MTKIQHNGTFIVFDYISNLDGTDLESFYNIISVHEASDNVLEQLDISNGEIQFGGYAFPTMFGTTGVEHTFSAIGQFHWLLDKWIKELSLS